MNQEPWYGVRLVYRLTGSAEPAYEERLLLVPAVNSAAAIARAERISRDTDESDTAIYTEYAMAFNIFDEHGDSLGDGVEVFSLIRKSELNVADYLDRFHDTGTECTRTKR